MDISSLSTEYQDSFKTSSTASNMEKSLKSDYSNATDEELMAACKQFESYFVEQMFKEMQNSIPKSEESEGSSSSLVDYFKDNLTQEYAAKASEQQDYGLAQTLYEQMKRNYSI